MINRRKWRGQNKNVIFTADVRHLLMCISRSPQTCDKKKVDFSRWFFRTKKMSFSLQTNDTFWCGPASRRRRATKKRWISRGEFFRAKKKLRLYWFYKCFRVFEQCEKNEFVRSWHQERCRFHIFMNTWGIGKKEQKNNNASRVRSEVFLMNFRIVKKPLGFIRKSRTTSDELKK